MKDTRMIRLCKYASILFVCVFAARWTYGETPHHGSLRDLERRARMAQALSEHVQHLQKQIAELQQAIQEAHTTIDEQNQRIEEQENRIARQDQDIEQQKRNIRNRDMMLRLFRSGDFEYYQVAQGDTLVSIASNPMVYGDASRAMWLAYANALDQDAELQPGTVLIIPRFAEGVQYDF